MARKTAAIWILAGLIYFADGILIGQMLINLLQHPDPPPPCEIDHSCPNGVAEF